LLGKSNYFLIVILQFVVMRKNLFVGVALLGIAFIWACGKDEPVTNPTLELRLIDAPTNYEAVNIDIQGAEVHVNKDTANQNGWQSINITRGVFNILRLTNGVDTLLGNATLPVGDISEIRLILGTNNTVKVSGQIYPLSIASGDESGLKLKFAKKLVAGVSYRVTLDFDAAKSIKEKGNNQYRLKPTLRLITEANDGSIRGEITPTTCQSVVYAINGTDTVSTYPSSVGKFVLSGLNAGSYNVLIDTDSPCNDKTVSNVAVQLGKATDIGKIQL
jgi:hypothetical protein